ncbi:MAG: radical SAM protein [Clostridia bacterium]|nr:radical SAM protein [Clostridia bacterium]
MLKKAYLEITDVCNLNCSFCRGATREKGFLSVDRFRIAAEKLRPFTEYLYLHLMGEPLLHPRLDEILAVCAQLGFKAVVTTNGVLLPEKAALLAKAPALYKASVSLHSFEGSGGQPGELLERYLNGVCEAVKPLARRGVIVALRLWNGGGADRCNGEILRLLHDRFPGEWRDHRAGHTLAPGVYLEYGDRFDWPDLTAGEKDVCFCMGLRDQIGVLYDGTVVPCCLDADGAIPLGNLFTDDLGDILASPRAKAIYDGFSRGSAVEALCRRCGYAERFSR